MPSIPFILAASTLAAPIVGVQYTPLAARFVGDLTDQTTLAHSVQIKTLYLDAEALPLRAYLAIDTLWTSATHRGDDFPYPPGASLDVLGFLFIAHLCWQPDAPMRLCGGLGQGTVNVNAARERRDWGTWNYQLQLDYDLTPHLSVLALGKAVGRVEQQRDGRDASFTLLMAGAGLGAVW